RRIESDTDPSLTRDIKDKYLSQIKSQQDKIASLSDNDIEKVYGGRELNRIIGDYTQGGANKFGYVNRERESIQDVDANQVWKWNFDEARRQREEAMQNQQWSYNEDLGETALKELGDFEPKDAMENAGLSTKTIPIRTVRGQTEYDTQYFSQGKQVSRDEYMKLAKQAEENQKQLAKDPVAKFDYYMKNNQQFNQFVIDNYGDVTNMYRQLGDASKVTKVFRQYNDFVAKNKVFEQTSNFITDKDRRDEALKLAKSSPTMKIYDAKGNLIAEGKTEDMVNQYLGATGSETLWNTRPDEKSKWKVSSSPYYGIVISTEGGKYKGVATPRELFDETNGSGMSAMNVGFKRAIKSGKPQFVNQTVGNYQIPMTVSPNYQMRNDNKMGSKVNIDYNSTNLPDNYKQALQYIESKQGYITTEQFWGALQMQDPVQTMFVKKLNKE
ncbi:MAG: hypothetical protein ACRCXN_11260, partial [Bacteroidales bacterium]